MDKATQSGRREKKTEGTTDNWKEIKFNDPLYPQPPKPKQNALDQLVGEIKYGGAYKGKK